MFSYWLTSYGFTMYVHFTAAIINSNEANGLTSPSVMEVIPLNMSGRWKTVTNCAFQAFRNKN